MTKLKKIKDKWDWRIERNYDFIYIVPNGKKNCDGYKMATYYGQIGEEIKIIEEYDCGNIDNKELRFYMQFDFELDLKGIKLRGGFGNKLNYSMGKITLSNNLNK